jgi:hypothetical protein
MDLLDNKTTKELLLSMVGELAKAQNEMRCANRDVDKANKRISFCLAVINALQNRHKD